MNKILSIIGIVITVVYLIFIWVLVDDQICKLSEMGLNEIGDFFAGVFGPIAIFWLILGFFQQGKELKQNTEALELQSEELRNTVLQQKELVAVAKEQYKVDKDLIQIERSKELNRVKPIFVALATGCSHGEKKFYSLTVKNTGETATDVFIKFDVSMERIDPKFLPLFEKNTKLKIRVVYENNIPPTFSKLQIDYTDKLYNKGYQKFQLYCPNINDQSPELRFV